MITKLKNPITEEYKELKKFVFSDRIPWHYNATTTTKNSHLKKKDMEFFSHMLLGRPQHEDNRIAVPYVSSAYFEKCYFILKEILDFNNIHFDVVYRMNLNLTLHSSIKESTPHLDLNFPHKNIIIYLSSFKNGKTIVLDKNNKKMYSEAKEDNIIMFDGKLAHYHESPAIDDKRIVMVANFL
tara:strand:+ start:922 stop:1470 length:549 start_codon:yes stop_codon:yes gene_type:complete